MISGKKRAAGIAVALSINALAISLTTVHAQEAQQSMCVEYDSQVFVERADSIVTQADFDGFLEARVPAEQRRAFLNSPQRVGEVLETLLSTYAMADRALSSEWSKDKAFQAGLYIALARELASEYRERYLADARLDSYEDAGRELYLAEPSRFETAPAYDFLHLLVPDDEDESDIAMLRRVLKAHDRIESGEDFEAVAHDLGSGSGDDQVLMEDIDPETLVAPLRAVLRDASEGDLTAPVRSQYGWHVARLVAVTEPRRLSWEEARESAIAAARQRHERMILDRLKQDIQSGSPQFAEGAVAEMLQRHDVSWDDDARFGEVASGMNDG